MCISVQYEQAFNPHTGSARHWLTVFLFIFPRKNILRASPNCLTNKHGMAS